MRRCETIEIQDRDTILTFKITEMSATQLESWIYRALLLLAGAGIETPDGSDISEADQYLRHKVISALGSIDYNKAKPLLDELLQCCQRILPNGTSTNVDISTIDGYVSDVKTLFKLRWEAAKFNLHFFKDGGLFRSPLSTKNMEDTVNI